MLKSRYVPIVQQPYGCVPACIQMVMLRHQLPLIAAEVLGARLGLVVPPEAEAFFHHVQVSATPPGSGYGTQIPIYDPNVAFEELGIQLHMSFRLVDDIGSVERAAYLLSLAEYGNRDLLICFDESALASTPNTRQGHVCVFDRMIDRDHIQVVDPEPQQKKWRQVSLVALFDAMRSHGEEHMAGIWELDRLV